MTNTEKVKFKDIIKSDKPVLVDFFASWCGPCKSLSPIIDELKGELGGAMNVVKIDVDDRKKKAIKYNIRSLPTLIIFKDGDIVWRESGVKSKTQLLEITSKFVDAPSEIAKKEVSTKKKTWIGQLFKKKK